MHWSGEGRFTGEPKGRLRHLKAGMRPENPVLAREDACTVELLKSGSEKRQAYRLRHRLFAEALRWVPESPSGLEIDEYDNWTDMIAVMDARRRVLGQVRVHEAMVPYMIEHEFAVLLSQLPPKSRNTAELTRFGVAPEARAQVIQTPWGDFDLFTLLLKGVYRWSLRQEIHTLYAVVDQRVFRLLKMRGFPFEPMGEPRIMPDGVIAVAVRMDWRRFEAQNRERKPALLSWFASAPAAFSPVPVPSRQFNQAHFQGHGHGLRPVHRIQLP